MIVLMIPLLMFSEGFRKLVRNNDTGFIAHNSSVATR